MTKRKVTNALRIAHLSTAITFGIVLSISDGASLKQLWIMLLFLAILVASYRALYVVGKPKGYPNHNSDTPIDDAVRRDLGIKD